MKTKYPKNRQTLTNFNFTALNHYEIKYAIKKAN